MIETGIRTRILGQAAAPSRERRLRLVSALIVGASVALLVLLLRATGQLDLWELKTEDVRTRWTLRDSGSHVRPDLVFIAITDDSIDAVFKKNKITFPWDWDFYALLLEACERGKASSILIDLFLREKREGSEELVQSLRTGPPAWFASAFWNKGKGKAYEPDPELEKRLARFALEMDNDGSLKPPDFFEKVDLPSEILADGMAGFTTISTQREKDQQIHRYHLLVEFRGRFYPSFALAALLSREKTRLVRIRDRVLHVGGLSVPIEADGSILLRWYPQGTSFPWIESTRVLQRMTGGDPKSFDPATLAGKTVMIGTTAAALTDLRITPVSDVMPGPELHLVALANVLNGDALRSTPWIVSFLVVLAAAFGVAFSTRFASVGLGGAAAVGSVGLLVAAGVGLFRAGRVIEMVPGVLSIGLSYAAASAVNFLYEGRQRQRIKRDFQRYMSPKVVEKILKNPDALSLKGERKLLTFFFMDFAGFTSVSEKVEPVEMVKLISDYHNEAAEEIFATEGTVDKYVGDLIMAFWNDPIDQEDHALRACLSAVAAQKRLKKMAVMMKERGLPEMTARIGLNTGFAIVGNMGARNQVNYTVIGDEVNLASRLEGVNKEFGTDIIISEATYLPCKDRLEARELALIKVKGRKMPVRIFELMGLKGEVPAERLRAARVFEGALKALQGRRFAEAWETFTSLAQKGDPAADVYAEVCEEYRRSPPPEDWDGAYQMTGK